MQRFKKQSSASSDVLLREGAGSGAAFISSGGPPIHLPSPAHSSPRYGDQISPCALLSLSPPAPTAAWSLGRPRAPTLYRAAAWALVWSAVRSSSGLPSFRAGLGPRTCRSQGRLGSQGSLAPGPDLPNPLRPGPRPQWGTLSCTRHPAQLRAGSRPPHLPGHWSFRPQGCFTLNHTKHPEN